MRARMLILLGAALALAGADGRARDNRSIAFAPAVGATESFAIVHQARYARIDGLADGPGASYRLSVSVLERVGEGYRARLTMGAVSRLPAAVPGVELADALAHSLDGLTFELSLDAAGRPVEIAEWGEFRIELLARAMFALTGDAAGELVASTTLRLIRSLDAREAAQVLARPLAVMAEVRDLAHEASGQRADLRLVERAGATLRPGPFDWDFSFEPALGGLIAARWQARPAAGPAGHREDGAGVWRRDGWPTRLYWTAVTLEDGDLTERTLSVTLLAR